MKEKIVKNIPNMITTFRIIMALVAPLCLLFDKIILSLIFFFLGAISDAVDGFLARRLNAYSELGKKLDGLSDKLFALSLIVSSIFGGNMVMLIPLLLEERIGTTNLLSDKLGFNPCTEKIGKIKTVLLFPTLILGVYAPYVKWLYYILIPLVCVTTVLQIKCIRIYDKKFMDKVNIQNGGK